MKFLTVLATLMLSLSLQAAPKKSFYCVAYDIIDVSFSGIVVDGKAVVNPGDVHVAIIDVPYLIPAKEVTMAYSQKTDSEDEIFHLEALKEGQKKPFLSIRAVNGSGRTHMDFKGVRLFGTPTACQFSN